MKKVLTAKFITPLHWGKPILYTIDRRNIAYYWCDWERCWNVSGVPAEQLRLDARNGFRLKRL